MATRPTLRAAAAKCLCDWGNNLGSRLSNADAAEAGLEDLFRFCVENQRNDTTRIVGLLWLAHFTKARDPAESERLARQALETATEIRNRYWRGISMRMVGEAQFAQGRQQEALQNLVDGYREIMARGDATDTGASVAFREASLRHSRAGAALAFVPLATARMVELLRGGAPAYALNACSWAIVRVPDLEQGAYELARRGAREAVRLRDNDWALQNTLGLAEYRCGDLQAAERAILTSSRMRAADGNGESLEDLLTLALIHHSAGRAAQAREHLRRARELAAATDGDADPDQTSLLADAERALRDDG